MPVDVNLLGGGCGAEHQGRYLSIRHGCRFKRLKRLEMGYLFLTGATGLLGSYLIRDLLCAGTRLAVLARPNRMACARMRIESQMVRWEKQLGRALPRPVVWEGDITQPDLGIGAWGVEWVTRNVTSMMHNAASLTFHAESPDSEPWISNVGGTRNVLEFCRKTDVRRYFHVSTAYVAGLRTGRVMESELDVGQQPGNDYEASKIQSEQLVRDAEFIEELTVFRPGIILGDSKNGYTATFHGFYVPLQILSAGMKKSAGLARTAEELKVIVNYGGERLRQALSMKGDEGKYFVPVDWVSAAMSAIFTDPSLHGKTYHLTPAEPVSIALVQQVLEENSLRYTQLADDDDPILDLEEYEKTFFEGMGIYKSYWRNDPQFDCTNVVKALPHLPCPPVDHEMLHVMCRFAMESNFGWPREPIVTPEFDVHEYLQPFTTAPSGTEAAEGEASAGEMSGREAAGTAASDQNGPEEQIRLGLRVSGRGGGEWELKLQRGRIVAAEPGVSSRCTATYYLNSAMFARIAKQKATVANGIATGRILVEGNGVPLAEMTRMLQEVADVNLSANDET